MSFLKELVGAFSAYPEPILTVLQSLLVVESEEAAAELCQMEHRRFGLEPNDVEALISDLGRVLEFLNTVEAIAAGAAGPTRGYADDDVRAVAHTARKLLVFAAGRGWPGGRVCLVQHVLVLGFGRI